MPHMTEKNALGTDPYKGVRDFYPEEMFVQDFILDTMRRVSESYGFEEYSASILEPTELYTSKTSDEIVNEQTYTFIDRGERSVTLRPEMTPTVARMIAARRRDLAFPVRWYSIPNLFRYERPQKGRLREHWQLNCDIFGTTAIEADVEIISLSWAIMRAFGATPDDFEIRVNSRKLTSFIFSDALKLSETDAKKISRIIDRKLKISKESFETEVRQAIPDSARAELLITALESETLDAFIETFPEIKTSAQKILDECLLLQHLLGEEGIQNVVFHPTLMRGFDYYTGFVFEVFDTNPENRRSMFGGGRYDNLTGLFGGDPISGVGFGMGDVTIRDFLESRKLIPPYTPQTDLYLAPLESHTLPYAKELAHMLRERGVNVAIDFTFRKAGDQVKTATRHKIPFVIVIGDKEITSRTFMVKNLSAHEESPITEGALAEYILNARHL